MFAPDRLKINSYRVLRLSANATLSEIHNAAAGMRRATMLGVAGTTQDDRPLLGEVPRSEGDIRTAVGDARANSWPPILGPSRAG